MIKKHKVVYTAGTFDLFNLGHVNLLKKSKNIAECLIVGVSTDELVFAYKKVYPIISYHDRVKILQSCKYIDKIVKQSVLMDIKLLKKYSVDCVTIGSDWKTKHLDGLDWMKQHRQVIYFPYTKGKSSTLIKRKIIQESYNIIKAEFRRELK